MSPLLFYAYIIGVVLTALLIYVAIATAIAANRERAKYALEIRRRTTEADIAQANEQHRRILAEVQKLEQAKSAALVLIEKAERDRAWLTASEEKLQTTFLQLRQQKEREAVLDDLQRKLDSLEERRTQVHQSVLSLESERRKLDDEIHRLQAEQGRVTNHVAELGHQVEQLQTGKTTLSAENAALERRRASLREDTDDLAAKTTRHTDELRRVRADLAQLTQAHADLTAQHAGLVSRREQLERSAKEAEERYARTTARIDADIEQAEQRFREIRDRVERDIADVKSSAVRHGVVTADTSDPVSEIWRPVLTAASRPNPLPVTTDEETQLEAVRNHLRGNSLVFPDRLVTAFHTSLKVAEDSPLLVLAGISGTGKSLLPRRYAEAMGMHFLPVPVQPRWDGPQDLLGFFHHLHGRYFATELCRALMQMDALAGTDQRSWQPGSEFESLADRMLLVLLDEMNLARVEYYFSEMISRLEMRRDIDPSDVAARAVAELLIDAGPRREGEGDARVYIDHNVLFVGTMNEDESVQSLSDRVIDRANVIRFARPTHFVPPDASIGAAPSDRHLQFATWKRWLAAGADRPDYAEMEVQIDQWLGSINDELAKIGRPFGHRVRRAIQSYIRHYPERGSQSLRLAMADQIEQRVLPKVRGIELGTPAAESLLDAVQRLCGELGDVELENAVREGRNEGHQFHWLGVARGVAADAI